MNMIKMSHTNTLVIVLVFRTVMKLIITKQKHNMKYILDKLEFITYR